MLDDEQSLMVAAILTWWGLVLLLVGSIVF